MVVKYAVVALWRCRQYAPFATVEVNGVPTASELRKLLPVILSLLFS